MANYFDEYLKRFPVGEIPAAPEVAGPGAIVKPTVLGNMAKQVPTLAPAARAASGALSAAGRFALPAAGVATAVGLEGLGVANVANDPAASRFDVATRAAEGVSRLAGGVAGAGLGAAGGSVFGPVGTVVGGAVGGAAGYFAPDAVYALRDYWRGRSAAPAVAPASPAVANAGGAVSADNAYIAATNPRPAPLAVTVNPAPGAPAPRLTTNADLNTGRLPEAGFGAIRRNGVVTNFSAPVSEADAAILHPSQAGYDVSRAGRPVVAPTGAEAAIAAQEGYAERRQQRALQGAMQAAAFGPEWSAGNRFKAALAAFTDTGGNDIIATSERAASGAAVARATGAETARKLAADEAKNLIDAYKARAAVTKDVAEAAKLNAAIGLTDQYLAKNPGDYSGAAGVLGLHPAASKTSIIPGLTPNDPVIFANEGRGAPSAVKVVPVATMTKAEVAAQAKANKETYEQGLARAAKKNIRVIE